MNQIIILQIGGYVPFIKFISISPDWLNEVGHDVIVQTLMTYFPNQPTATKFLAFLPESALFTLPDISPHTHTYIADIISIWDLGVWHVSSCKDGLKASIKPLLNQLPVKFVHKLCDVWMDTNRYPVGDSKSDLIYSRGDFINFIKTHAV